MNEERPGLAPLKNYIVYLSLSARAQVGYTKIIPK